MQNTVLYKGVHCSLDLRPIILAVTSLFDQALVGLWRTKCPNQISSQDDKAILSCSIFCKKCQNIISSLIYSQSRRFALSLFVIKCIRLDTVAYNTLYITSLQDTVLHTMYHKVHYCTTYSIGCFSTAFLYFLQMQCTGDLQVAMDLLAIQDFCLHSVFVHLPKGSDFICCLKYADH